MLQVFLLPFDYYEGSDGGVPDTLFVQYGIERYYVPEGEGKVLEEARNHEELEVEARVSKDGTAQIARLHAPAGLPLGSRTPPEIALAIVADLTARRNGASLTATVERPATESAACPLARAA